LTVIKVEWINDGEAHIYVPDVGTWWTRPIPTMKNGDAWELADHDDEVEGYYESAEDAFEAVGEKYDMPVLIAKDER
jgi:hypothetical protein